ncbi:MAG: D-sedoheptulose 7-phosphate isomerase [Bacteroidales bacterium]|jgi:D-sedoheptulose 7-phosphate isomerase|nr:D-sedoheptulose 7-phosphate isomerase [Bacteroidales bacterium]NLM91313.1 D-sedoheptulose 7-phosphate isomerase [Bacteroidales bacterium]
MRITEQIEESIRLKQQVLSDQHLLESLEHCIGELVHVYDTGHKVLLCGNGGSAADAQHLASELSGRFYFDRPPLNAEALHVNTSFLTAVANDYSFDRIYERMVQALGKEGDMLLAFSTSGNSPNIVKALEAARKLGMTTVGFTGREGGEMNGLCDILFKIPSADTPRIQEIHILLGHIICENVEGILFKE